MLAVVTGFYLYGRSGYDRERYVLFTRQIHEILCYLQVHQQMAAGIMLQSSGTCDSVGIAASYFTDNIYETISN
jgi:hypothetical protein